MCGGDRWRRRRSITSRRTPDTALLQSTDAGHHWTTPADSCQTDGRLSDAIALAARDDQVDLLCGGPNGDVAVTLSDDDATSFGALQPVPLPAAGLITNTGADIHVATGPIGGEGSFDFEVAASDDSGKHWRIVAHDVVPLYGDVPNGRSFDATPTGPIAWIGDPYRLLLSLDRGTTWTDTAAGEL